MSAPILIIVHARRDRAGKFDAEVGGERIVRASRVPFCDACRELLRRGHDPATRAVMRHAGSDTLALQAAIGRAATLMVEEGNRPRFARWRPFGEGEADLGTG